MQELWVKVRSAHGPVSQPLAYLYRMADRQMLDHRKSALRRTRREQEWGRQEELSYWHKAVSDESALIARDQLRSVETVLESLGKQTQRIFRRYRIEGVAQHEIAREMGISVSAIEKHLQKAYRALLRLKEDSVSVEASRCGERR